MTPRAGSDQSPTHSFAAGAQDADESLATKCLAQLDRVAEDERSPQLKAVLDRAVKRERDAIKTHDTAARKHDFAKHLH